MNTGCLLNATFWIDQLRLALWKETCHFLQHGIQELIFGYGFDHFPLAKDDSTALSTGKPNIGITRLTRAIDHAAHNCNVDRSLHLGETLLYFISYTYYVDFDPTT